MTLAIRNFGPKPEKTKYINFSKLKDSTTRAKYDFSVEPHMIDLEDAQTTASTIQTQWENIREANRKAALDTLYQRIRKRGDDITVIQLSERQRELKDQTNSAQDQEKRTKLYKVGNETLNSIHQKLKDQEYQRITEQIDQIENSGNDSSRRRCSQPSR